MPLLCQPESHGHGADVFAGALVRQDGRTAGSPCLHRCSRGLKLHGLELALLLMHHLWTT